MREPVRHGAEWWSQAADGSWLRWNETEYRWDRQPGAPPFPLPEPEAPQALAVDPPVLESPAPSAAVEAAPAPTQPSPVPAPPPVPAAAPAADPLANFEPADGKARIAITFVAIVVITAVVRGVMLLQRTVSDTLILESSPTLSGITTFYVFAILASFIASLVWLKAAYDNLAPLGAAGLRYTPGWAIGAWFIPVGNLFIPKQITDDTWRASDPELPPDAGATWKFKPVPSFLHLWWIAWIARWIFTIAGDATATSAIEARDLYAYRTSAGLVGAGDIAMAAAGALFIRVIDGITSRQRDRVRALQSQRESAPAAPE